MKTVCVNLGYTDDGCVEYRCGSCRATNETRCREPKFCMYCGAEYIKVMDYDTQVRWKNALLKQKGYDRDVLYDVINRLQNNEDTLAARKPGYLTKCVVESQYRLEAQIEDDWYHVHDDALPIGCSALTALDYLLKPNEEFLTEEQYAKLDDLERRGWTCSDCPLELQDEVVAFIQSSRRYEAEIPLRWVCRKTAWEKSEDGVACALYPGMADVTYYIPVRERSHC